MYFRFILHFQVDLNNHFRDLFLHSNSFLNIADDYQDLLIPHHSKRKCGFI